MILTKYGMQFPVQFSNNLLYIKLYLVRPLSILHFKALDLFTSLTKMVLLIRIMMFLTLDLKEATLKENPNTTVNNGEI
jgi:hypothetical protein